MLRILMVDDDAMVRGAMRRLLRQDLGELEIVEVDTVAATIARVTDEAWDVVLLDLGLPDGSGVDAIAPIRTLCPAAVIVVVSSQPEDPYAAACRRNGAFDFVPKEDAPELLAGAVRRALGLSSARL
jgi:DNA-binding NarL/FixJ family response regulator